MRSDQIVMVVLLAFALLAFMNAVWRLGRFYLRRWRVRRELRQMLSARRELERERELRAAVSLPRVH